MNTSRSLIVLCLIGFLTINTGCGKGVRSATPEAAIENLKTAGVNKDFETVYALMAPNSQQQMTEGMLAILGGMKAMAGLDEKMKEPAEKAAELAKKFGLTDEVLGKISPMNRPGEDVLNSVKDKAGFTAAMMSLMESTMEGDQSMMKGMAEATLSDVKIDGDSATGTLTMNGRDQQYGFKKIDGSWRIEVPGPNG